MPLATVPWAPAPPAAASRRVSRRASRSAAATRPTSAPRASAGTDTLPAFVAAGPLAPVLRLGAPDALEAALPGWERVGEKLCTLLGVAPGGADAATRARVYHYYLPTYYWLLRRLEAHRAAHAGSAAPPALVVRG